MVLLDYIDGYRVTEIAHKYSRSHQTVSRILKNAFSKFDKLGIPCPQRFGKENEQGELMTRADMQALCADEQIQELLGIDYQEYHKGIQQRQKEVLGSSGNFGKDRNRETYKAKDICCFCFSEGSSHIQKF